MKYINQINMILMGGAVAFCLWAAAQTFLTEPEGLRVPAVQGASGAGGGASSESIAREGTMSERDRPGTRTPAGSSGVVPSAGGAGNQNLGAGSQPTPAGNPPARPQGGRRNTFQGNSSSPQANSPQAAPQRRNPLAPGSASGRQPNVGRPAGTQRRGMTRTPPPVGARGSGKRNSQSNPSPPAPRGSMRRNN